MPTGVYIRSEELRRKISLTLKGKYSDEKNSQWKGGKTIRAGYILLHRRNHPFSNSDGYVKKSRLAIEQKLGRYLKEEIVHHINGIRNDDRFDNLMAFTNKSAHIRFHHNPNNVKPEEIIFDGRNIRRTEDNPSA